MKAMSRSPAWTPAGWLSVNLPRLSEVPMAVCAATNVITWPAGHEPASIIPLVLPLELVLVPLLVVPELVVVPLLVVVVVVPELVLLPLLPVVVVPELVPLPLLPVVPELVPGPPLEVADPELAPPLVVAPELPSPATTQRSLRQVRPWSHVMFE
jgi:hypothetical protein